MKRKELIQYLKNHGCVKIREGKRHTVFYNPKNGRVSTVPRHREIDNFLAIKICKDLGIKPIKKK